MKNESPNHREEFGFFGNVSTLKISLCIIPFLPPSTSPLILFLPFLPLPFPNHACYSFSLS